MLVDPGAGGAGTAGHKQSTTSQTPASIAAAERQTIPAAVAPPKSTISLKFEGMPRYSATAEGANRGASGMAAIANPSTSYFSNPASSRVSAASWACASSANSGGLQIFRGAHS